MSFNLLRKLNYYRKKFGIIITLKIILQRLGINFYPKITYPLLKVKVKVNLNRYASWKMVEKGLSELNCFKFLKENVKKGQTILDIGAYKGDFTLFLSKIVGKDGKVYAFEPDPNSYSMLCNNIKINNLKNVFVRDIALSNKVGKNNLLLFSGGGLGRSSLIHYRDAKNVKIKEIKVTTIDKFCQENDIYPDGIKIDVEGAESLVIDGCKDVIKEYSPWVLLEFHDIFMSEEDKIRNWEKFTDKAKKVIFIDGDCEKLKFGCELKNRPNCIRYNIAIQY